MGLEKIDRSELRKGISSMSLVTGFLIGIAIMLLLNILFGANPIGLILIVICFVSSWVGYSHKNEISEYLDSLDDDIQDLEV